MQAQVRRARAEDLAYVLPHLPGLQDALCRYYRSREHRPPAKYFMGGEDPHRSSLSEAVSNSLCLIAESDGQIVGILTCRGGRYAQIRHTAILEVFVSKEHRRKGIGSALVREAIAWARETDAVRRIEIRIPSSSSLGAFYGEFGFDTEGILREAALETHEFTDIEIRALIL